MRREWARGAGDEIHSRPRRSPLFDGQGSPREEKLSPARHRQPGAGRRRSIWPSRCGRSRALTVPRLADVALVDVLGHKGELGPRRVGVRRERSGAARVGRGRVHAHAATAAWLSSGRPILIAKPGAGAPIPGDGDRNQVGDARAADVGQGAARRSDAGLDAGGAAFSAPIWRVAQDLAARIGTAIERAQLYNQAKEAVAGAAGHPGVCLTRSEELAHEPVSERRDAAPERTPGRAPQRVEAARSHPPRASIQMRRMIEDLLDVGSIDSGRLAIDSREHEIGDLFEDAVELQRAAHPRQADRDQDRDAAAAVQGALRSRADDAGLLQPDRKRGEVRPRKRDDRSFRGRLGHERAGGGARHRPRHPARAAAAPVSTLLAGRRNRAQGARASASSSPRGSSKRRAASSGRRARSERARRSSLRLPLVTPSLRVRAGRRRRQTPRQTRPHADINTGRKTVSAQTIDRRL